MANRELSDVLLSIMQGYEADPGRERFRGTRTEEIARHGPVKPPRPAPEPEVLSEIIAQAREPRPKAEMPLPKEMEILHPEFAPKIMTLMDRMATRGLPMTMFEGVRSAGRQRELFERGASQLPGSQGSESEHQFGIAADVVFMDESGKPYWPDAADEKWELFGEEAKKLGLTWGGDWKMKDMAHIQMYPVGREDLRPI